MRSVGVILFLGACTGCPEQIAPPSTSAWPEADALFLDDERFLGADAAYSALLPDDRVLWLFGDTFVSTSPLRCRALSRMVKNSAAIQTGRDPSTASIEFFFGGDESTPAAFFGDDGDDWLWPGTPLVIGDQLLLFMWKTRRVEGGLGFETYGSTAFLVENPADDPPAWRMTELDVPNTKGIIFGTGGAFADEEFLYLLSTREPGDHAMFLARAPITDPMALTWWNGTSYVSLDQEPAVIFTDGGTELSMHRETDRVVVVQTAGFPGGVLTFRTAPSVTGPWSARVDVFRPPESDRENTLVYAGKAHPELVHPSGGLIATYVANNFDFGQLVEDTTIYFPRFVVLE